GIAGLAGVGVGREWLVAQGADTDHRAVGDVSADFGPDGEVGEGQQAAGAAEPLPVGGRGRARFGAVGGGTAGWEDWRPVDRAAVPEGVAAGAVHGGGVSEAYEGAAPARAVHPRPADVDAPVAGGAGRAGWEPAVPAARPRVVAGAGAGAAE